MAANAQQKHIVFLRKYPQLRYLSGQKLYSIEVAERNKDWAEWFLTSGEAQEWADTAFEGRVEIDCVVRMAKQWCASGHRKQADAVPEQSGVKGLVVAMIRQAVLDLDRWERIKNEYNLGGEECSANLVRA